MTHIDRRRRTARFLNRIGVAAFVLKFRVRP